MITVLLRLLLYSARRTWSPHMEIREAAHILQRENESQDFSVPPSHSCSVCNLSSFFLFNPVIFSFFVDSQNVRQGLLSMLSSFVLLC